MGQYSFIDTGPTAVGPNEAVITANRRRSILPRIAHTDGLSSSPGGPGGDQGVKLNVTQPVVRLEPGQEQQVRFILETDKPLSVEQYKRVVFEGIPPKSTDKNVKVGINLRQDLPVLIHPKDLPVVTDAWKLLTWSVTGKEVKVQSPSAYVVRFSTSVTLLPSHTEGLVNKTFILPGETMTVQTDTPVNGTDNAIEFNPASRYGIEVESFTASLTRQ